MLKIYRRNRSNSIWPDPMLVQCATVYKYPYTLIDSYRIVSQISSKTYETFNQNHTFDLFLQRLFVFANEFVQVAFTSFYTVYKYFVSSVVSVKTVPPKSCFQRRLHRCLVRCLFRCAFVFRRLREQLQRIEDYGRLHRILRPSQRASIVNMKRFDNGRGDSIEFVRSSACNFANRVKLDASPEMHRHTYARQVVEPQN